MPFRALVTLGPKKTGPRRLRVRDCLNALSGFGDFGTACTSALVRSTDPSVLMPFRALVTLGPMLTCKPFWMTSRGLNALSGFGDFGTTVPPPFATRVICCLNALSGFGDFGTRTLSAPSPSLIIRVLMPFRALVTLGRRRSDGEARAEACLNALSGFGDFGTLSPSSGYVCYYSTIFTIVQIARGERHGFGTWS